MLEFLLLVAIIGVLLLSLYITPKFKVYVGIPLGVLGLTYIWFFLLFECSMAIGFHYNGNTWRLL